MTIATIVTAMYEEDMMQGLYLDSDLVAVSHLEPISAHDYAMKTLHMTIDKLKYKTVDSRTFKGYFPDELEMNIWDESE